MIARAEPESSCVACHKEQAAAEKGAVHQQAGIACVECHGGDPAKPDKAASKAAGTGYRGKIARTANPELCGGCHSDVRRMNPYGLPTDQLAHYKISHHGEALFQDGDEDVAVCSDCHRAHGIRRVRDPESPVFPKNVPETCAKCHGNAELMAEHGLSANEPAQYQESVHAELLHKKGDLSAPTCVTCHGNHGAVPPGFQKVGLVCGKCHIKQKEFFELGPHAGPARQGDFETCVTCHGNHKVVRASDAIYQRCKLCHDEKDEKEKAYPTMRQVRDILATPKERYAAVTRQVQAATRAGFHTEDEQLLLEEAKTSLLRLPPLQHSLDVNRLRSVSQEAQETMGRVEAELERKLRTARWRKLSLIPIAAFLVLMSLGFRAKLKQVWRHPTA